MEYRVIRTGQSDDHFEHALFGGGRQKGAQNKNHKYLARAWWQNKWRYAYTQAEVAALQNLGKARQTAKDVGDKAKAGAAKVTKAVSDVASGKYARDVDSRADRYAESAAQRSAASKRQSASGREQQEMYRTANKVAEYNEEKANKFTNKLTGKSKMYKEAATSDRNAAKTAAAEGSRLISMSRENSAAARSDAKKAAEAEAEKNTAAYKISKAAGNASRAAREAADRVSDTARDVGNRVSNAARSAADSVRNSSAGRYVSNTAEVRRAERERDEATASGNRQAAIDAENRRENAETQRRNAASDARNAVTSVTERGKAAADRVANRVSNAARGAASKVSDAIGAERAERERDKATASGDRQGAIDAENRRASKSNEINSAIDRASDAAKSAANKGKAAVERLLNRASNAAKAVGERATDTANRATDSIDRAVDKVKDAATTAARKAAAQSVKMEYGADSPQYRAAKAQVDYDKAVDDLSEARDKYGVNSSQYKQAMRNEAAAREEKNEALKAAKLDSRKSNSEKAKDRITSAASSASEKGKAAVERLLNRASSAAKAVSEVPGNIKKTVNETRNYHEKVDAERAGAEREYRERSKIHAENFDKYHDPNSSAEQKAEADKALNDNWKPMWEADIKKRESKQAQKSDDYKKSVALDKTLDTIEAASAKGRAAAENLLNRASSTARDVGSKVSAAAERVADRVSDIKESAEHKAYASEMKRKYGADSLRYKDAQALLDHDKAVDDLAKARDKYGVNSSEYKAAMRKEQRARDAMDEVHEQNLYANYPHYTDTSDRASEIGAYLDNMDARGGPQTAEGKANYRKMQQELDRLEADLERMRNRFGR